MTIKNIAPEPPTMDFWLLCVHDEDHQANHTLHFTETAARVAAYAFVREDIDNIIDFSDEPEPSPKTLELKALLDKPADFETFCVVYHQYTGGIRTLTIERIAVTLA